MLTSGVVAGGLGSYAPPPARALKAAPKCLRGVKLLLNRHICSPTRENINFLSSTNVMCTKNHCSAKLPSPINIIMASEVAGVSAGFMLDSNGQTDSSVFVFSATE